MRLSADLIQAVMAATNDGLLVAKFDGSIASIIFANPVFSRLTGYSADDIHGRECFFLLRENQDSEQLQKLTAAVQQQHDYSGKFHMQMKDGRFHWIELRTTFFQPEQTRYLICIYKDVTQDEYVKNVLDKVNMLYREMSKRLEYTNETDHLTRLKNRGHLCTRGEFMLGAAKREKLRLHAILIDVDSFRILNGIGGQALGDDCLIKIADIIRHYFCRATDIAIRMGDDEFAVICIEDDDQRVHERAESLRRDVRALQVKDFSGRQHELSVSIGIYSITPEKSTTIEDMIHNAGQLIFSLNNNGDQIVHRQTGDNIFSLRH
jgi:diguanylate cyclase (GGDEF)-like protein/PAS domain S-box-containing protein